MRFLWDLRFGVADASRRYHVQVEPVELKVHVSNVVHTSSILVFTYHLGTLSGMTTVRQMAVQQTFDD